MAWEVTDVAWSLEQAYGQYPLVEAEFAAALDESLDPRGPGMLFDLVAGLGLARGATAIDIGCGEGDRAIELARRFGFSVTGIDPVLRHIEHARAAVRGRAHDAQACLPSSSGLRINATHPAHGLSLARHRATGRCDATGSCEAKEEER